MIMYSGKVSYAPNTLNNNLNTYYFAHWWQHQNTLEVGDPTNHVYTYENWIKLIKDVYTFNRDYCGTTVEPQGPQSFFLFNDWDIYGDAMFLTEFQAVATFDTAGNSQPTVLTKDQQFPITSKLG